MLPRHDLGPGRREWSMVILCMNDPLKYDIISLVAGSSAGASYEVKIVLVEA